MMSDKPNIGQMAKDVPIVQDHKRSWRDNHYVYPVISRRAGGLSIGINLNPDKACTFDCIYCEVNRRIAPPQRKVELPRLTDELNTMLDLVVSGEIWQDPYLSAVPTELRRLNDIAFSGDGEPTAFRNFDLAVEIVADARAAHGLESAKIVVISNATCFHTDTFRRAIPLLQETNGEVWAKLDAGTAEHFRMINKSQADFEVVLQNIEWLAVMMPITIQTMFLRIAGETPSQAEIDAYIGRLRKILEVGGQIQQIQAYTVARPPADAIATALSDAELDCIVARIQSAVAPIPVKTYYGADVPAQEELI